MKQVHVTAFCDGADHEERTPAIIERTVRVDRGDPVVLDLCEGCDKTFIDLLVLMERGAPPAPDHSRPSRLRGSGLSTTCPECGKPSKTRSALGQHTRKIHGKGLKEYPGFASQGGRRKA